MIHGPREAKLLTTPRSLHGKRLPLLENFKETSLKRSFGVSAALCAKILMSSAVHRCR